jgi:hypothetical protein
VLARATGQVHPAGAARTTTAIGAVLLVAGLGLIYVFETAGGAYAIEGVAAAGLIGVVSGAVTMWLAGRPHIFAAATVVVVGFIALNAVFILRMLPSFEAYKPVPLFAETIARRASHDAVVATYDQGMPSLVYYLRRHVVELFESEELVALLRSGKSVYLVVSSEDFEKVRAQLPGALCVIDRRPTFDVRLRNILAREALPELLVVTNRCGQ